MLGDFMYRSSELAFFFLDGVPIANTVWIIPWIIFWSIVMISPLWMVINIQRFSKFPYVLVFFLLFFFGFLMVVGLPIGQISMLQECERVETTIETERASRNLEIRECRFKENYYGNFGEWELVASQ